ncbi:hypothetical protein DFH09DRAFT_1081443 [Mycena vulgaris]|nr:hypothetical protein DFH09DRAFT_1081443 [Mycena vulgaris]
MRWIMDWSLNYTRRCSAGGVPEARILGGRDQARAKAESTATRLMATPTTPPEGGERHTVLDLRDLAADLAQQLPALAFARARHAQADVLAGGESELGGLRFAEAVEHRLHLFLVARLRWRRGVGFDCAGGILCSTDLLRNFLGFHRRNFGKFRVSYKYGVLKIRCLPGEWFKKYRILRNKWPGTPGIVVRGPGLQSSRLQITIVDLLAVVAWYSVWTTLVFPSGEIHGAMNEGSRIRGEPRELPDLSAVLFKYSEL